MIEETSPQGSTKKSLHTIPDVETKVKDVLSTICSRGSEITEVLNFLRGDAGPQSEQSERSPPPPFPLNRVFEDLETMARELDTIYHNVASVAEIVGVTQGKEYPAPGTMQHVEKL